MTVDSYSTSCSSSSISSSSSSNSNLPLACRFTLGSADDEIQVNKNFTTKTHISLTKQIYCYITVEIYLRYSTLHVVGYFGIVVIRQLQNLNTTFEMRYTGLKESVNDITLKAIISLTRGGPVANGNAIGSSFLEALVLGDGGTALLGETRTDGGGTLL